MSIQDRINQTYQKVYNTKGTIAALYKELEQIKSSFIARCETYASWTLPTVLTSQQTTNPNNTEQQHDFQSIGARAVNHLSNKIAFSLFNPARPFFKLEARPEFLAKLESKGLTKTGVDTILAKAERLAMNRFVTWRSRTAAIFALKSIIILGNSLLYFPPRTKDEMNAKAQAFNFRDYVVKRDLSGKALEIITRDRKKVSTLPGNIRIAVQTDPYNPRKDNDDAELFTRVVWNPDTKKYHIFQAVDEYPLTDINGSYTEKELPWIPLTWDLQRGADYGTGLVEDYAGDFHALSTLTQSMVIGAAIAADIKFLVDPAGNTDYKALNDAETGAYVPGKEQDISTLTTDKVNDWTFVSQMIQGYEKRLGLAFLLGSAVTRDAERVTAEEIRFQAQELETALGGQYSRLSEELQMPLAYILLKDIDFSINGEEIDPIIVTGLESLSRNSEVDKLILFLQDLSLLANLPEQVQAYIKVPEITAIFGNARAVDYKEFIKDDATVQKEQAAKQQQLIEMQQKVGQNDAVNSATAAQLSKG